MHKLICMISTVKNTAVLTTLLTDSLSFFTLPCGCHDATFIIFFLPSVFCHISFHLMLNLLPPPLPAFFLSLSPSLSLAGTDAGIFELIGTNRRRKTKADKGRAEERSERRRRRRKTRGREESEESAKFFRQRRERKRRGRWGGKRFRSRGLWMNATDR